VFTSSGLSSFAQDPLNQAGDRGLSAYDRRHRFVITYIWEVPYVHRTDSAAYSILHALTSHWEFSGFATFQSGIPQTINSGVDTLGDGSSLNDRPTLANASLGQGDFARYSVGTAGSGVLGNDGRNTYIGPNEQC